jgi:hypothetical protein
MSIREAQRNGSSRFKDFMASNSITMDSPRISLSASVVTRVLGGIALLLVLASLGGQVAKFVLGRDYVYGLVSLFNVDLERNIPAAFSTLLLLVASLLLALIAALHVTQKLPHALKWVVLSCGFLVMAYDEAFQIHENLEAPVKALAGDIAHGFFYFAWVIPGMALVLVLGLYFLRFLFSLPGATRFSFLFAATLFLGGSIGLELIGGRYVELHGRENLTYNLIATAEESLEMAGVIVFIRALLRYLADTHKEVRLQFE